MTTQRICDEAGAHVSGKLPSDDPAAKDVEDEGEEHQPLPRTQVREVRDPQPVGCRGGEIPADQIRPLAAVGSLIVVRHGAQSMNALNSCSVTIAPGGRTATPRRALIVNGDHGATRLWPRP